MVHALLVDDEEPVLKMLADLLALDGFSVMTATSAAQATEILAREQAPDIVITDLRMESPLAGFDVVKAAKRMAPRPVIVVLTAFPVPASDWRDAGADALVVKGENPLGLSKQLRSLLSEHPSDRNF
jgi:DNA-binding response OmpR family regulator